MLHFDNCYLYIFEKHNTITRYSMPDSVSGHGNDAIIVLINLNYLK